MANKLFGLADPYYDALRVQSNQAIWPDAGGGSGSTGGTGLENKIYLWPADGSTITTFDPDEAGVIAANTAAASGDTVWLPSMTIAVTAALVLKAGVMVRGIDTSAIISRAANNASDIITVQGPSSGTAYLSHITIICTNSGSGDAVALDGGAGQVYAHDSYFNGTSTSGVGYGVRAAAGIITLDDCWIIGSTTPLAGAITSAGYFVDDVAGNGSITITSGAGDLIGGLIASQWYAVECTGGPFNANPADPKDSYHYTVSNDGGSTWDGLLGHTGDAMELTAPAWGVNPVDLDGKHARFFFQTTTSSILIRTGDFYWADNTGSLGWRLYNAHYSSGSSTGNIITSAVRMNPSAGEPAQGDRSAWDALNWAARHTNDTDNGIHHTLTALDDRYLGASTADIAPVGWLAGWSYRIPITVANADGTYTNKKVPIDVNTTPLIEAALCNADLSDLRVTAADGLSLLPFYRANDALLFNETNFSRYASNPVITSGGGGAWDNGWIHPYSIIDMGDGTYRMYYGGHPTPGDSNIPNKVGYATSSDGISWTKYGSNPIFDLGAGGAWDDTSVEHFQVIRINATTWKAWYAGEGGTRDWKVGYATSSDGISWSRSVSNPVLSPTAATWDSAFVVVSDVWIEGATYYMLYWGGTSTSDNTTWKIGLATSSDGIAWTKSASNPVMNGAGSGAWDAGLLDCSVQKIGDTYILFYQGNVASGANSAIGIATSTDLITWTRSSDNPLPRGTVGQWDTDWNEGPVLIRIGAAWMLYYMGKDSSTAKSIGLMQFPDTRLWPIIPSLTSSGTTLFVYYGNASATNVSTGSAGSPDGNITITNGSQSTPDFAAWNDETQPSAHAADISDATYTLHLNPALTTPGTFGDANNVAQITVDARGLITAAANVAIALPPLNVYNETASGDGSTTIFYLANIAAPSTIRVYIDGIRQPASDDTDPTDIVSFSVAPALGALLLFDYEMELV